MFCGHTCRFLLLNLDYFQFHRQKCTQIHTHACFSQHLSQHSQIDSIAKYALKNLVQEKKNCRKEGAKSLSPWGCFGAVQISGEAKAASCKGAAQTRAGKSTQSQTKEKGFTPRSGPLPPPLTPL